MKTLLITILSTALLLSSCKKEETKMNPTTANNTPAKVYKTDDGGIDYSRIQVKDGTLVFESWEHFNEVKQQLADLCNAHTIAYLKPFVSGEKNLVDDELIEQMEKDGFNAFKPVHDFCNKMGFESFYQVAERKEKVWMNQNVEKLDEENDPFLNIERYESALLNKEGNVLVNGNIENLLASNNFSKNANCDQNGNHTKWVYYYYNSSIGNRFREMKSNIGPRPFQSISSTTMRFRRLNGTWAYWFTNPHASVQGITLRGTVRYGCNDQIHFVSYKNSQIPWGFYVYNFSWHGTSPTWNIKFSNQITSVHKAPGYTFNHGY